MRLKEKYCVLCYLLLLCPETNFQIFVKFAKFSLESSVISQRRTSTHLAPSSPLHRTLFPSLASFSLPAPSSSLHRTLFPSLTSSSLPAPYSSLHRTRFPSLASSSLPAPSSSLHHTLFSSLASSSHPPPCLRPLLSSSYPISLHYIIAIAHDTVGVAIFISVDHLQLTITLIQDSITSRYNRT